MRVRVGMAGKESTQTRVGYCDLQHRFRPLVCPKTGESDTGGQPVVDFLWGSGLYLLPGDILATLTSKRSRYIFCLPPRRAGF